MSDSLEGQRIRDTYGRILQIANANDGADGTLRAVRDGRGDATPLYLSTSAASVRGSFTVGDHLANSVTVAGAATGEPVTITSAGDASPDIRFVLPSRGLVNMPRVAIGSNAVGASTVSPRLFTIYDDQTLSTTGDNKVRIGGILRGSVDASFAGLHAFLLDEDRLDVADGEDGFTVNRFTTNLRNGWRGGRTLHSAFLTVGSEADPGNHSGLTGAGQYLVAGSAFAYSYTEAGGRVGDSRGNLFARNDATRLRDGSGYHWNSVYTMELDVGVASTAEAQWKGGMKIVQWSDDATRGSVQDFAYGLNTQASGTAPGWRVGFALGAFEGWWPFTSDSTVMKALDANTGGGPSKAFAVGIDFRGVTIGEASFIAPGFHVDGSGDLGAVVASGVSLQTRSEIVAKTAVVASATVLEGGLYAGTITLTGTAPTGSGTTATFAMATCGISYANSISNGGSGYAEGDTFTVSNGTGTVVAEGFVTKVLNGEVLGIKMTNMGSYSSPPATATTTATSGAGSGMTFVPRLTLLTVSTTSGSNYSEFLPPTVTSSGSLATYRQALIKVNMTASAAALTLANNYANYATFTGASAGGTFDASAPIWQAAGSDTHIDLKALGKGTNGRLNTTKLYVGPSANRASVQDSTRAFIQTGGAFTTTAAPGLRIGGDYSGTVTSGQAFFHQIAIDSDTVDPTTSSGPDGAYGLYLGHTVSAGAKGGRTAFYALLNVTGAITADATGAGAYQVAAGARADAAANAGGTAGLGNGRGNLFGGNRIAVLKSGATYWDSIIGDEVTLGAQTGSSVYYKNGMQIVLGFSDAVAGTGGFYSGLAIMQTINGSSPGWDYGITFGHALGWWPMNAAGTLIGTVASTGGLGPSYAAAWGIDLSAVTFSSGFLKSSGFEVDGSGRLKITTYGNYADDVAAAAGGVPVTGVYRNGSVLMVRVS